MINNEIKEQLRAIYKTMPKESLPEKGDGWVNLSKFGLAIRKAGIDYKALGYEKLGDIVIQSGSFAVWIDYSNATPVKYLKEKTRFSKSPNQQARRNTSVESAEITKVKTRLRLENNLFIGQFSPSLKEGFYKITDIRNTDFTKIEDKERGIKDLYISFKSQNLEFNRFAYYKFTWVILESSPLRFGIDLKEEVIPVYPRDIVRSLHDGIIRYPAGAAKKISSSLDTLKKQLTQSGKEVFIYELLQNANDYPRRTRAGSETIASPVEVEFHITNEYLTFQHTGEYFNAKNIAAICDINDGEKSDNIEAIGYKGIGFKTVFLDNDYVYLNTGNYSFSFDKSATDVINTPWQILPVWMEPNAINNTIRTVFRQHPNDVFRVKFALQPRNPEILTNRTREDNYIDLFSNVFDSERVILFIPNIKKVSIFFNETTNPSIVREKDNKDWCVSDALVDKIPEEVRIKINDVLDNPDSLRSDGYEKIPEKYKNFYKTAVKFACKKEGRKLLPVEDSVLYCYLPAKRADWGFHFLMNTDMVPNGQRDDIEDIELNHVIARIAGKQFFWWIKSLIDSDEYELDSIFSLIPDFEECKKRRAYKTFIEEFQEEFEALIKEEAFVPVVDVNGTTSRKCINQVVNDMTGLTAKAVISDKDFISLLELDKYCLPVKELRNSESFADFIYKYSPSELDIKIDDIVEKCESEEFKEWLSNIDNNTLFIKHLLNESELEKFTKKSIFIEYEGGLFTANTLYYDFDAICTGIEFLRNFIPHLCTQSRDNLSSIAEWRKFVDDYFVDFNATKMINTYVIGDEDVIRLLDEPENSVSFYNYLAINNIDLKENNKKIPYITENEESILNYSGYLYFFSEQSQNLAKEIWIGNNSIRILSHKYFEGGNDEKIKEIFIRLGFLDFDKASFASEVIASDTKFLSEVNLTIENDIDASKAFIDYVYSCCTLLKGNLQFKDYVLCCVDINGGNQYLCNDDVRYFNQISYAQNSTYKDNLSHEWLSDNMMYALSDSYFDSLDNENAKKMESFLRQYFGIKTFTDKSFFSDVVIKNKKVIYESLVDNATMLSFLAYLKRDAERIFDDSLSFNDIKDMPLLCYDGSIISNRDSNVQYLEYDDNAIALYQKEWCPKDFVILSKDYTADFSVDMRQLFKIGKFELNAIIESILSSPMFAKSVKVLENNIDFWRWVKHNQKTIHSFDKIKNIQLKDTSDILTSADLLYISDIYQQDGIESLVKIYIKDAKFVSSTYIENNTDIEKDEWLRLFKKLELKSDNKDILFKDVLPHLASFENDTVITMMTKHLKDLQAIWSEKLSQIIQLRVKTRAGEYKAVDKVIIVSVAEDSVVEPLKHITLSDEIHPDILKNNRELLLLLSNEFANKNLITSKQAWVEAKVREYIQIFNTDEDSIVDIHIKFVRELAKLQSEYDLPKELKSQIKYRTSDINITYKFAHELTLGSSYSPICDFEANGVQDLFYLSNDYIFEGNKDIIKSYFKGEGLHQNMQRENLKFLSIKSFACYFWSYCFSRRISEYETWIEEGLFTDIICIPTESSVQKAESLYAPSIASYAVKANAPQWKEKVPLKTIVDKIESRDARALFERLNFSKLLSFEDCLYYLARVNDRREEEHDNRRRIINWILSAPNHDQLLVSTYRNTPTSTWRNGKGKKKHITELYAIHPDAMQERNIFRGDEYIMQTGTFPYSTNEYEKVCEILQIKCLNSSDFVATPIGKDDETAQMITILRPRLLVLAAIDNPDKFQKIYELYNEKVSQYHFVVCEKIDLGYNTIHNDVERIYNDESHIYYVSSWMHPRTYTKLCSRIKKLLGFDIYDNVCEDVLDINNSVESLIEKYCSSLAYDESFRSYLQNLNLSINVEIEDEESSISNTSYYSDTKDDSTTEVPLGTNEESTPPTDQPDNTPYDEPDNSPKVNVREHERSYPGSGGNSSGNALTPDSNVQNESENSNDESSTDANKQSTTSSSRNQSQTIGTQNSNEYTDNATEEDDEGTIETNTDEYDTYSQIEDNAIEDNHVIDEEEVVEDSQVASNTHSPKPHSYNPDRKGYMGSVEEDDNYQPLGSKPWAPRTRKHPKNFTGEEINRLRSNGTPLELESLQPTTEEINMLAECNITPEQISDSNYLAQLRLYLNLTRERNEHPAESMEEFVHNASDVSIHKMKDGQYVHSCSAARGVMYISPSVWNMMVDDQWKICVYLDGQGKNFHYINNADDFLKLVEKDDVVIKITGKEKVEVVKALYSGILKNVKGTAYTLIRVAARTNMDAVFAHYVGSMAEAEDGNEDLNDY